MAGMNLTDPAVREAGARALYGLWSGDPIPSTAVLADWWDHETSDRAKQQWRKRWDRIAAELAPVLAQADAAGEA